MKDYGELYKEAFEYACYKYYKVFYSSECYGRAEQKAEGLLLDYCGNGNGIILLAEEGIYHIKCKDIILMKPAKPMRNYSEAMYKILLKAFTEKEYDNKENIEEEPKKRGHWIYWDGWCGNHDMRIEDAVCSECGYKHHTVRWEQGDPQGEALYESVLNKLSDKCPNCGVLMQKKVDKILILRG